MEKLELKIIYVSVALMIVFAFLVLYAGYGMGIALPTHHQHISPFAEDAVIDKGDGHFEVHYVAKMWSFQPTELVLPENADVELLVSAIDVNHGFQILGTDVNLMAVPGAINAAHQQFHRKGDYLVVCHEYCGLNHQRMFSKIRVVAPEEYTRYQAEVAGRLATGEKLAAKYECTTCHTTDGSEGLAPTFKGMFGRKSTLTDGSVVIIDEAYIFESVHDPDRHVVKGFDQGSMPPEHVSDDELKLIIAYLKKLK